MPFLGLCDAVLPAPPPSQQPYCIATVIGSAPRRRQAGGVCRAGDAPPPTLVTVLRRRAAPERRRRSQPSARPSDLLMSAPTIRHCRFVSAYVGGLLSLRADRLAVLETRATSVFLPQASLPPRPHSHTCPLSDRRQRDNPVGSRRHSCLINSVRAFMLAVYVR